MSSGHAGDSDCNVTKWLALPPSPAFTYKATTKGGRKMKVDEIDLTGQRFGRLTALERVEDKTLPCGVVCVMWRCVCDCGNEKNVWARALRLGETKSCGCAQKEIVSKICRDRAKHGCKGERLYGVWGKMIARCENPHNNRYKYYGANGIKVCKEWRTDYLSFRKWALDNGYDENAKRGESTIDRIDPSKGYCPENCRFVNSKIQNTHKSDNRILEYNGKSQTITEWAREVGIKKQTLFRRINSGWSIEDALTTPVGSLNGRSRQGPS